MRGIGRLSSGLSAFAKLAMGSTLSVLDFVQAGSSMSLRARNVAGSFLSAFGRFNSGFEGLSMLNFVEMGSSSSIREFAKFGSAMSVEARTFVRDSASI